MKEREYTTAVKAYGNGDEGMEGTLLLRNAIIIQAVDDYTNCLERMLLTPPRARYDKEDIIEKNELEGFFFGDWFQNLVSIVPMRIIEQCRENAMRNVKVKLESQIVEAMNVKLKGF